MVKQSSPYRIPTRWTDGVAPIVPASRFDVRVEVVGDEAVVYDGKSTNTFHFNPPALSVWRQCDGKTTTEEMAQRQTACFDVDEKTALDHVEQLVAKFAEAGLLEPEVMP